MAESYQTKQKILVLDALKANADKQFSAEELYNLISINEKIGRATVFRTLSKLSDEGCVQKIQQDSGTFLFQYDGECSGYHLKCLKCGTLSHLHCGEMLQAQKHILSEHHFHISSKKTILYGVCEKCSKK